MHVGGDIVRTTGCISVDTGDACTCPKPEHYLNFQTTSLTVIFISFDDILGQQRPSLVKINK